MIKPSFLDQEKLCWLVEEYRWQLYTSTHGRIVRPVHNFRHSLKDWEDKIEKIFYVNL